MVDAVIRASIDDDAAASLAARRHFLGRVGVYAFLTFFAFIYILPLFVIIANSFRELPEIVQNGLIGFPHSFSLKAWSTVWSSYCVGGTCAGIQQNFYNSLEMAIPATIISTMLGLVNGYILSKWRFPGSETIFTCMMFGVFMPGQISLMPWAFILGHIGLSNTIAGLDPDPLRAGHFLHHAVLPQLLRQHPRRSDQGGAHRRRRLLAHFLQDHSAALAADHDRDGDLAIHRHLERISLRRRLHRRTRAADHRLADRHGDGRHQRAGSMT